MVVLDEYGNSHHRPEIDVMSAQAARAIGLCLPGGVVT
jgi:hypothetical protein